MKKKYNIKFVPNTHFAKLEPKNFGLKLEKSIKIFWSKIGRNENFIMQSGYWKQTLFYIFFSFIIEKNLFT